MPACLGLPQEEEGQVSLAAILARVDGLHDVEVSRLSNMATGGLVTQMLSAAASLGIADRVRAETATTGDLADRCEADPDSLGAAVALPRLHWRA